MRKIAFVALTVLAACTATPIAVPPTPTPSASQTVSPSPTPSTPSIQAFNVNNVVGTIREIVARTPYRVAGSAAYGVAGSIVEAKFRALGYTVKRQPFSVPA